ncbi:MAG: serine/threonine protein kinase [Deltaproteobacteria bacterium]|nr:serine/threonine protein kinase [Deltaproteobacteria bacterium]
MNPSLTLPASLPDDIELLETLGAGTFGTVYVARVRDGALTRTVVLKVLKQDWSKDPEALRRARDEAAMLSRLNHDNIVRVERLTTWRGHVTVVMEHLLGLSLDQVLRHHGPLPVWSALEITSRVCSALDAAYAGVPPGEAKPLRIVHRDIKPSNILLTVSGAVKVLDFGAARAEFDAREAATRSMAFGTPLYMAPECFDAGPPGPPVDIYALGATLVELISGEPLGKLSVSPQRFWPALQARLKLLRFVDLPEGPAREATLELISRTLRYDPDRRPDAQTLRAALRELMNKQPIPRFGLDQLGETVVDPLYRRREVLPATPPDGSLAVQRLPAAPPPTPPPTPQKITDAPDVLPPSRPSQKRAAPPPTVPTPPPRVKARPAPETPRRGWLGPLAVMGAGLGVGGMIALALFVGNGGQVETVEPLPVDEVAEPPQANTTTAPEVKPTEATSAGSTPPKTPPTEAAPVKKVEEPAVKAPPKPPPPTGALTVKSLPAGATASAKGVSCTTPCTLTLPQGAHKVSVTFPSSAAGPELSGSCTVQLAATGTLKVKRVEAGVSCE